MPNGRVIAPRTSRSVGPGAGDDELARRLVALHQAVRVRDVLEGEHARRARVVRAGLDPIAELSRLPASFHRARRSHPDRRMSLCESLLDLGRSRLGDLPAVPLDELLGELMRLVVLDLLRG